MTDPLPLAGGGLRVLFTNTFFRNYSGSELYVRDVALALRQRGHWPIIYSPRLGALAEELRQAGVPVADDLRSVEAPDLIHGQHHLECMTALARYPGVPVIYFCHGVTPWATPPRQPRIRRYVAVSDYVRQWLLDEHRLPAEKVSVIYNFVNLERFRPRGPLPPRPERALIFSNQARADNYAGVVQAACAAQGLAVDIVGLANGNPCTRPETLLGRYDLVFARGRCALESLATGAAVICCDTEGAGPLVTSKNQAELRRRNLGKSILTRPITVAALTEEILRYDRVDAHEVSVRVRAEAGLEAAVDRLLATYAQVLAEWAEAGAGDPDTEAKALAAYLGWLSVTASGPTTAQLAAVQSQLHASQAANRDLQAALASMENSLAWRAYRRLAGFGPLRAAYRAFARPFKARGSRRRAQSN